LACAVLLFGLAITGGAQDVYNDQTHRTAEAMLTDTDVKLPEGVKDIFAFVAKQDTESNCETIQVNWIALPGHKGALPAKEARELNLPQTLRYVDRKSLARCGRASYRTELAMFPYMNLAIFGMNHRAELLGLHVEQDPREMIVECPELFGGKSTAETKCGIFIMPETTVGVRMPRNPDIEKLEFYLRVYKDANSWHFEKVGEVRLPKAE
jgi:hypothetical protein